MFSCLCLKGNTMRGPIMDRIDSKGTKRKIYLQQFFFYGLVCEKSTFESWKSLKHGRERRHFVSGSLRLWRHKQGRQLCVEVYLTSWDNLFLLFIDKERTNMAVLWGGQIRNKNVLLSHTYWWSSHAKPAKRIFAIFLRFQTNVRVSARDFLSLATTVDSLSALGLNFWMDFACLGYPFIGNDSRLSVSARFKLLGGFRLFGVPFHWQRQ